MVSSELIAQAAELIRKGGLVAFPTETVYGLGADALNPDAVRRIFEAKRRPLTSPLIVHVNSVEMARSLARRWPREADLLAARFWPGPLTLVVPKAPAVPEIVTAGLDTVGLRMPAHEVALALITAAGVGIAAPSANPFTQLSPATAEHVRAGLGNAVDLILDGGPSRVGIESTVLSLATARPVLLRPGMVTKEAIEEVIGAVDLPGATPKGTAHPSPGMHARHYSPRTAVVLVRHGAVPASGRGVYLGFDSSADVPMPLDAAAYAAALYSTLHRLDGEYWDWIAIEQPPDDPEWAGVRDRLQRAAHARDQAPLR